MYGSKLFSPPQNILLSQNSLLNNPIPHWFELPSLKSPKFPYLSVNISAQICTFFYIIVVFFNTLECILMSGRTSFLHFIFFERPFLPIFLIHFLSRNIVQLLLPPRSPDSIFVKTRLNLQVNLGRINISMMFSFSNQ